MAHLTSAAALRTARVILREYDLIVRPPDQLKSNRIDNLTNSEGHVAIIIDYATNIYHLSSLRPEVCFWQQTLKLGNATAPQITGFLKRLMNAFELLPKDNATEEIVKTTFALPPGCEAVKPPTVIISKPAKEVSRFIFNFYEPKPKASFGLYDEAYHRTNITYLAEASLGLRRAYTFFPKIQLELKRLIDGKATESEVKQCLRTVGIVLEYIPTYEDRQEEGKILV